MAEAPKPVELELDSIAGNPAAAATNATGAKPVHGGLKPHFTHKFSRLLVERTQLMCGVVWGVIVLLLIILVVASGGALVEQTPDHPRSFYMEENANVKAIDSFIRAREMVEEGDTTQQPMRSQQFPRLDLSFMYVSESNADLLNADSLKKIYEDEQRLVQSSDWTDICLSYDNGETCARDAHTSIFGFMVSALGKNSSTFSASDITASSISQTLALLESKRANFLLGKDYNYASSKRSPAVRSLFKVGLPFKGFANKEDRIEDQKSEMSDFVTKWVVDSYLSGDVDSVAGTSIQRFVFMQHGLEVAFNEIGQSDSAWMGGSVVFVFFFIAWHTGSFFLASTGMVGIVLSFPLALLCYKYIYGVSFFQTLHLLVLFIIIGIGADDIFVFVDAWNQAPSQPDLPQLKHDLVMRMQWTYARASKAMFVTTLTTACAFAATGVSRIMPIATFGYFAASVLVFNYVLVITLFPLCVITWERRIRHEKLCCWHWCRSNKADRSAAQSTAQQPPLAIDVQKAVVQSDDAESQQAAAPATATTPDDWDVSKMRFMERFLHTKYSPFVEKARWPIIVVMFLVVSLLAWQASQMQPLSKQEEWFPADHVITQTLDVVENDFSQGDNDGYVRVSIPWGISGIDRLDSDPYDPSEYGDAVWDSGFSLAPAAAQTHVREVCRSVRNQIDQGSEWVASLNCFMEGFEQWLNGTKGLSFPFQANNTANQETEFNALLREFSTSSVLISGFSADPFPAAEYDRSHQQIGFQSGSGNTRLRFISIDLATTLRNWQNRDTNLKHFDYWNDFVASANSDARKLDATSVADAFQTTDQSWAWMETEREFVVSAFTGLMVSLLVTFLVLVFSTMNIWVAIFSTATIISIVTCIVGFMKLYGWELGVTESVAMVILIGFSVDYVVHLANSYVESHFQSRQHRTQHAVLEMGISVISGAMTTFLSSIFLWFPVVRFYYKFAALMMTTVTWSIIWSMTFFLAVSFAVGPEGNSGSLQHWWSHTIKPKLCGKKASSSSSQKPVSTH